VFLSAFGATGITSLNVFSTELAVPMTDAESSSR
jgi:hypothetical protein